MSCDRSVGAESVAPGIWFAPSGVGIEGAGGGGVIPKLEGSVGAAVKGFAAPGGTNVGIGGFAAAMGSAGGVIDVSGAAGAIGSDGGVADAAPVS